MRFFITIGDKSYPPTRLFEQEWTALRHNRSYVCGMCGDVWARWEMESGIDHHGLTADWYPVRHCCPNHQWGTWHLDHPGSLISVNEDILLLPKELLKRELLLLTAPPVADESGPSDTKDDNEQGQA